MEKQPIMSVRGIDPEVQRRLKIRAAETGETIGQIVERALRKELGMTMQIQVAVVEAGDGYIEQVAKYTMTVPLGASDAELIDMAKRDVVARGYEVMDGGEGGSNEVTRYSDGTVAVNITVWPTVTVINPWSGARVYIRQYEVTPERLEALAMLMGDEIREDLHREFAGDPWKFWCAYIERVGPEEAGRIWCS